MDDLVSEFIGETRESLSILDRELVRFEQTPGDKEILSNIFRMMHTIKGTCGFLGLPRLEKVAHAGEDVLGRFRDGDLQPTPEAVTLILECIDQIRALIDHLGESGTEGPGDDADLITRLKAMAAGEAAPQPAAAVLGEAAPAPGGPLLSPEGFPIAAEFMAEFEAATGGGQPAAAPPPAPAPAAKKDKKDKKDKKEAPKSEAPIPAAGGEAKTGGTAPAQTIRVNVEVLENLMTLVSEMVLTRNQLLQLARNAEDSVFKDPIQRLSRTTSELQDGVMKTRMQPIGGAWGKLPRIVRDLANELGKKINLEMHGEDTELDRQVLELIQDPLTHMVRNSADHGLERPDERVAKGKPEVGTIRLSASHEGGHIIIEIADDGRGLNTEKIRAKALERGLATAEELAAMDDHQVNQFIMRAGFSTAEAVTKVSGRGVGMDVVRSNIEKIGGTVEFKSVFGQGSVFTIKIPLTLAIISSLIVQSGEERFALPQIAVNEVVRVSERSEYKIESLKGAPVLRLRNSILPLVNLQDALQLEGRERAWSPGKNTFEGYVVVCRNGSQTIGVIVDAIADSEEIVVKPLSAILGATKYFSGNTILGDGRVILILDLNGLASNLNPDAVQAQKTVEHTEVKQGAGESILLFRTKAEGLKAVPLSRVNRIESFDMRTTESVQGELVVQYRDRLLPLLSLDGSGGIRREGRQSVLVFELGGASVGFAIETIVDIVHDTLAVQKSSQTPGVTGSGIVANKAVDIVDPDYFIGQLERSGFNSNMGAAA
jgi:two-component system chemotaxis sensor kinase CheA